MPCARCARVQPFQPTWGAVSIPGYAVQTTRAPAAHPPKCPCENTALVRTRGVFSATCETIEFGGPSFSSSVKIKFFSVTWGLG